MDAQPTQLRITSPAEAAQLIPYLVGFTPAESMVVCAIQNSRVQVTARVDLADVQPAGAMEDLLDRIWNRFPDADGFAFAYTADHQAGWNLLARCDDRLPHGCQAMLIDNTRWHTPDGTTGTIDLYGPIAAQATYAGLAHLPSRADLEARFASAPESDELDHHMTRALDALPNPGDTAAILALARDLINRNLPERHPGPAMPVVDAVQLAVLAQHPGVRDLALISITRDNADQHLQLWQNVINASPAYGADMPLYLAGMAAWITGDGASATIALERSLAAEPPPVGRHPARLLEGIIDNVIPPTAWDTLRRDIAEHAHPDVKAALPSLDRTPPRAGWPPTTQPARQHRPPERRRPPAPGITI
jgi:hypothetical protein